MESSGSASKREHEEKEIEKGKEKERGGGASNDDSDEEANDGEGIHGLHQTANSALQGLLRKLGAGMDDILPPPMPFAQQNSRLKRILSGLRAEGEVGSQVEALTQLCDMLSIATEDSLCSFSVDSFVPVLVALVNHENNADIMLLAARALTHLCDVLPQSCASVVHYGGVPSFCARLLTIEYMDLAEQSLQALEKISHDHPAACLRAGALMAVLSYLDFFSTGVQRVALSTAANICKKLPSDAADFVMEAVPILTNLLQYNDSKVVEHASVCLTRIAESFASSSEKLDELCNHGLVERAAQLISVSNSTSSLTSLSTPTYTGLIRLLSTFASGSALSAKTLLDLNISSILRDVLAGSSFVLSISGSPALNRPPDQAQTLADHIKFDHGYTFNSPPIINLLEIMREFAPEQRRAFLRFVTGAPRLPPGGLASLNPKLTIVRKHPSGANGIIKGAAAQAADADLPSVMTCANYLKLPPYSCKEVMRDRLLYAITEGQGSFDLS